MDLNVGEAKLNQVSPLATSPGREPGGENLIAVAVKTLVVEFQHLCLMFKKIRGINFKLIERLI
jgi:hypothetical protein